MIKIYGTPQSSSGRCYFTLEEVGEKYEAQAVDFKEKEHKSAEFLKINPNGKVPALIDGDTTVWESIAINYYLCDKYKPELLGASAAARAHVQQWSIWGIADVQPPLVEMLIEKFFVPAERKNPEVNKKCFTKLEPIFKTLDVHLEGKNFLADDKFSLAELNLVPAFDITAAVDVSLSDYPNVQKWMTACHERDSYKRYMKIGK